MLNNNAEVHAELENLLDSQVNLFLTPISIAELYHGIKPGEESALSALYILCECIDINASIGKSAGHYLKRYSKSHNLEIADALIAACCTQLGYWLCTFNWKHYPMKDIQRYVINR